MKITLLLSILGICQAFATSTYSQTTRLTIDVQNTKLKDVLTKIEDESEFYFLYSSKLVDTEKEISVKADNLKIDEILTSAFKGLDIDYTIVDRQIILSPKAMMKDYMETVAQQQKKVSGKVTDSSGATLPAVSVVVKGTTTGIITDSEGNYSLSKIPENATLQFSFVGMKSQDIIVGDRTTINVTLAEETIGLDEVVAIGYGTQKKVNLTGAISAVTSKVLESRPISNIGQGLQGIIPNLNVTQSTGTPGQGASYNIRGFTSITGGQPLILVDNIPMDINNINPNDIEGVSVLKDAASAAIYGARASYGVILITTRSGKKSVKPKISLSSNYSINAPTFRFEEMDALERMNYCNTASMAASGVPYYQFTDIYKEKILAHYNDPSQPAAFPDPNNPNKWLMSGNTNWEDVLFRKSYPMQQNSAAISGGTDHFDYYTSLSYLNQDGLSKQSDENYKRYNFLSNFNVNVTKWLRIGTRASVNIGNKIWGPLLGEANTTLQPFRYSNWPVYAPDGSYAWDGSVPNAVQLQKEGGYQKKDNLDMWLTGYAKFTPVKNMTFNIDYSYNATNTNTLNYWRRLPEYYIDGTLAKYYPGTNPSQVTKTNYRTIYSAFNAFADYENAFGKHTIKALLGFNQEHSISENLSAKREQLIQETIPYLDLAYGTSTVGDGATEFAIRGAFSRLNYNFDNRYLIEFNNRYDGTSKFPKKDRFKFFPSVSIGWRLDNEAFFAGLKDIVNMLKFKASYGNLGNQNVTNNYPYVPTYSTALVDYLINGALPMANYAPGLVREALTWETVTQQNIGLELALLENRLHTNVDVYRRDTKNMLTKGITLPALLANPEPNENAADLKTTGFDLELEWRDRIKSLNYGITVLLSDNTSFITKYDNPKGIISDYYVGRELSEIWGFDTGGIFQTDEAAKALDQSNITGRQRKAGDLWFKDLNGDGKITYGSSTLLDPGDRKIIGNSNPRYNFGIKSEIEWKGFDLTLFFQGVGKRDLAIANTFWVGGYTDEWSARNKKMTDWWTKENPDAYFPRPLLVIGTDVTASQTRFLQNGAYIRLKQLTLGYTIPMNLSQKAKIEKIRVYFSGNNLWELTDIYKNVIDPEMNNLMNNPIFRSFSIGANINF